uniref:Acyltransferase PGAP2 n=1 Tax=Phallusia mammillata TaxID=59560 RepID=A0A6F9DPA1_9ASCI|nr:post-GPI attachment to proteins factor 2-like [Phallusia mammillata]
MKQAELVGMSMFAAGTITVLLPFFALTFAIVWSLLFAFDASTRTHCHVPNYLPTVSAAIGLTPQAYVWRACIGISTTPRLIALWMYRSYLRQSQLDATALLKPFHRLLSLVMLTGHFVEIWALLVLSVISSTENGDLHEYAFITFMVGGITSMITDSLNKTTLVLNERERQMAKRKLIFCILNITSFVWAVVFYFQHNWYCKPGVYTLFAFFEYIVILSNMGFYYTQKLEMVDYRITVVDPDGNKIG